MNCTLFLGAFIKRNLSDSYTCQATDGSQCTMKKFDVPIGKQEALVFWTLSRPDGADSARSNFEPE